MKITIIIGLTLIYIGFWGIVIREFLYFRSLSPKQQDTQYKVTNTFKWLLTIWIYGHIIGIIAGIIYLLIKYI